MINMVSIIDTESSAASYEKMEIIDFKSLKDLKKVAVKYKIPIIFKCKNDMGIEDYYFFHEGILHRYFKHHQT